VVYVLIALVLLSIVAAMLKLLPSAEERMLARLRKQALSDGLRIKVTGLKDLLWWPKDGNLPILAVAAYWKTKELLRHQTWLYIVSGEQAGLESVAINQMSEQDLLYLRTLKAQLGQHLIAVEAKNSALWVYWIESEKLYPALMAYFQCYK